MDHVLTAKDLKNLMHVMYPDVEDDRDDKCDFEHPMTAVGIVLLTATLTGTIDERALMGFTGYSRQFVSAIALNMLNNRLWSDNGYDHSNWLLDDGTIDTEKLWEHIDLACGSLWLPNAHTGGSTDPCDIYWDEGGGLGY